MFEIDRDRFTCSGGTAALDMMLHLIGRQHGQKLATDVWTGDSRPHPRAAQPSTQQVRTRLGVSHPKLLAVIADMEDNIEEPLN